MPAFDPYHKWLGIPPEESGAGRLNHYRLLGLTLFEADAEVIASAADQRMAHLRTFQTGPHSDDSQTLLNQVTAAKLCLLRSEKKAPYDAALRRKIESAAVQPAAVGSAPAAESRVPLRRPLRIAAPLTPADNRPADSLADSRGADLGSLGFDPGISRVVKKSRRAKTGGRSLAYWAPIAAVIAVLVVVWAASQSGSAPPPNVAMQDTGESPAPRADAHPAKPTVRAVSTSHISPKPLHSLASLPIEASHEVSGNSHAPEADSPVRFESPAPRQQSAAAGVKPRPAPPRAVAGQTPPVATGKPVPVPTNAFVVSLAQDKAGNVWVGTEDLGVFRYDPCAAGSAQWTEFTTRDGLGDDNAYALCVDQLNRV